MRVITIICITGCEAPATGTVPFEFFRIFNAVPVIDKGMVHVLFPVIGITVLQSAGIESGKSIVCEKQGTDIVKSQRGLNAVILLTVHKMVALSPAIVIYLRADGVPGR